MIEPVNAIIKSVNISKADHDSLVVWLHLEYGGGTGQGFGGHVLYLPHHFVHHSKRTICGYYMWRIMEIADVLHWKDIPGKCIRVISKDDTIKAIGHITESDWFCPEKDLECGEDGT